MNEQRSGATTGLAMPKRSLDRHRLPRLAWLLKALGTIRSTRLTDDNHLRTNVIAHTLQTRDEALGTLAFTATPSLSTALWHSMHIQYI